MGFLDADNALQLRQGESKTFRLTVTNEDDTPVDLTGVRVLLTVKGDARESIPRIRKDSSVVGLPVQAAVTDALAGVAEVYFFPNDTKTLDAGVYVFDLWVIFGDGRQVPVIPESTIEVLQSITRLP